MNVGFDSRVTKRFKAWDLRKLGNFEKIPKMLGINGEHPRQTLKVVLKNCIILVAKHLIEISNLLNLVNLSTTFCPRFFLAQLNTYLTDNCCCLK